MKEARRYLAIGTLGQAMGLELSYDDIKAIDGNWWDHASSSAFATLRAVIRDYAEETLAREGTYRIFCRYVWKDLRPVLPEPHK